MASQMALGTCRSTAQIVLHWQYKPRATFSHPNMSPSASLIAVQYPAPLAASPEQCKVPPKSSVITASPHKGSADPMVSLTVQGI